MQFQENLLAGVSQRTGERRSGSTHKGPAQSNVFLGQGGHWWDLVSLLACSWPSWCWLWQTLASGSVGSPDQSEYPEWEKKEERLIQEPILPTAINTQDPRSKSASKTCTQGCSRGNTALTLSNDMHHKPGSQRFCPGTSGK